VRVLYFYRDDGVHDRRFLAALGRLPVEVIALQLENRMKLISTYIPAANIQKACLAGSADGYHWHQKNMLARQLKQIYYENQVDVVHAGPVDLCAWLAASAGLKPLVSMSWGYDLLVHAEKSLLSRARVRYALKRTEVLLADCRVVVSKAETYGFPSDRIVTFPWGVDLKVYHPRTVKKTRDRTARSNQIVLLSTRTMEKLYGCDVIVEAFIKAARVEEKLRLTMLGDGSQKPQLIQRIKAAGLERRVNFTGILPEEEMITQFHASDVYISASHSDGSSVSLLQAMACGLPAIVSDIPGNREWVSPGHDGWLFKDGDSDGLAALMIESARSQERREAFGVSARMTAVNRADWQKNNIKLLDAYHMAIEYQHNSRSGSC
jgi:glycosyltransferase involved in cell wall biosynthesis